MTRNNSGNRMPALFIGHGSPMNAIEDTPYGRAWERLAAALPRPQAILCLSAHWQTKGTRVTAMSHPRTIHDFSGFPEALNTMDYPAAGSPPLADDIRGLITAASVELDQHWGLDHGCWAVICRMYPEADIPVVQLSLDRDRGAGFHYALGAELAPLRDQGVLIIGSGNIVHNLALLEWADQPCEWAVEFDATVAGLIRERDHQALIHYETLGRSAALSIPTNEHYLPLLAILALQGRDEEASFFAEGIALGSLSMRGVQIGS